MKTKVLQLLVLFLVFGIAQEAKAQWKGTWRTNEGNIQINGSSGKISFGLLDYTFSGTTSNVMNNVLTGTYFVKPSMPKPNEPAPMKSIESGKFGERGTFTLTLDRTGQKFSGEWKNEANPNQKGTLTGTFVPTLTNAGKEGNKDIEGTQRKKDLENRKVDISGANLKAAVPWVGSWKLDGYNSKWKIIQLSPTKIQIKGNHTVNKQVITIDATAEEVSRSKNGQIIYYKGTHEQYNNTTKKRVTGDFNIETSKDDYNKIKGSWWYPNPQNTPKLKLGDYHKYFDAKRISAEQPNMSTYN